MHISLSRSLARSHSLYRRTKHTKALLKPHSPPTARQLHLLFFFTGSDCCVSRATAFFQARRVQIFFNPLMYTRIVRMKNLQRAGVWPIFAYFWMCHLSIDSPSPLFTAAATFYQFNAAPVWMAAVYLNSSADASCFHCEYKFRMSRGTLWALELAPTIQHARCFSANPCRLLAETHLRLRGVGWIVNCKAV